MPLETNLFSTVTKRAEQFAGKFHKIKMISNVLIEHIDAQQLTGQIVYTNRKSLAKQREDLFVSWPHGSLTDARVRLEVVRLWPDIYANPGVVQTETLAVEVIATALQDALDDLMIAEIDPHPTVDLCMDTLISSPATDALRAAAVAVRSGINGPV